LIDEKQAESTDKLDDNKPADPIYGNALARTWNWLNQHAVRNPENDEETRSFDFGIEAFDRFIAEQGDNGRVPRRLLAPSAIINAPVILPAYLDLWCQTAPRPLPEPDVALFLHGPKQTRGDVQVCWRADLVENEQGGAEHWPDTVSLLPPTSAECMSVQIGRVRQWLEGQWKKLPDGGDLLEGADDADGREATDIRCVAIVWRGPNESRVLTSPSDLRPGDTLVLSSSADGASLLGHLPELDVNQVDHDDMSESIPKVRDLGEMSFLRSRDRAALRLHPSLRAHLPSNSACDQLFEAARSDDSLSKQQWQDLLRHAADTLVGEEQDNATLRDLLEHLAGTAIHIARYPDGEGVVIFSHKRMGRARVLASPLVEEDESFRIDGGEVLLVDHLCDVCSCVKDALAQLPLEDLAPALELAARLHDLGKADERFQALLRGTNRVHAWLAWGAGSDLLAKSAVQYSGISEYRLACERADLPLGWRHEMLSVQLAEHADTLPDDPSIRDLVLHLIASHHGHARPFAPVVPDDEPPGIKVEAPGFACLSLTSNQRAKLVPPHRLDSGIVDRFWRLTRRFGWWGLAYLEAVLRLGDQQASAAESAGQITQNAGGKIMGMYT